MKIKGAGNQGCSSNHAKYRTWVASSGNHAKYRTRGFQGLQDVDVVENTPRTLPKGHVTFGHYRCCTTSGDTCALPREHRRGQVTFGHIR